LAELRATAEFAVRWPEIGQATASLTDMLCIGREMERLVESLLLISRGNAAAVEGDRDRVPVAPIVHDCLERADGSISEKGLKLNVDLDERSTLQAPPDVVEIMVRNLIDNAVQYTPADGSVTIRDEGGTNGTPTLIVENDPVDLVEEDLPRLFEPFWRGEGSRSDREHVGLGMAVVHQIARATGLRVDAGLTGDRLQIRVSPAA
jgi:signal transduction histidine kinase